MSSRASHSSSIIERLDARRTQGGARSLSSSALWAGKSSLLKARVLPQLGPYRDRRIVLPAMRPEKARLARGYAKLQDEARGRSPA